MNIRDKIYRTVLLEIVGEEAEGERQQCGGWKGTERCEVGQDSACPSLPLLFPADSTAGPDSEEIGFNPHVLI